LSSSNIGSSSKSSSRIRIVLLVSHLHIEIIVLVHLIWRIVGVHLVLVPGSGSFGAVCFGANFLGSGTRWPRLAAVRATAETVLIWLEPIGPIVQSGLVTSPDLASCVHGECTTVHAASNFHKGGIYTSLLLLNNIQDTEHQFSQVSKRLIFINFLSHPISNAFLNLISNIFSLLQALWQARWPVAAEGYV
jgi:hypothetical protein